VALSVQKKKSGLAAAAEKATAKKAAEVRMEERPI